jgi:uncharacterized protein (TIGR02284 family)
MATTTTATEAVTKAVDEVTRAIVKTLNTCIETCTDGEKGYAAAAADVRDPTLKALFSSYEKQRADFVRELQTAIDQLGAFAENEGTVKGTAHRGFVGARLAIEGRHDSVLLAECERGERGAIAAYDRAFSKTPLDEMPAGIQTMLMEQRAAMKVAHDDVLRRLAAAPD